tara:strand:- start:748 stop:1077 length:330 start_codon:yes stop_codon:yes gene_type:complete
MTNLNCTAKVSHKKKVITVFANASGIKRKLLTILWFLRAALVARNMKQTIRKSDWVSITDASKLLKVSTTAIRQRLLRKDKPMPQSNVCKQAAKGLEIFINATNYRKDM